MNRGDPAEIVDLPTALQTMLQHEDAGKRATFESVILAGSRAFTPLRVFYSHRPCRRACVPTAHPDTARAARPQ